MADREIARLEQRTATTAAGPVAVIMLVLGSGTMVLSLGDNSAIRGAMYAAIWTGWNVIWGAVLIASRRVSYTVFRREE